MSLVKDVFSSPKGAVSLGAFLLVGAGILQPRFSSAPDPGFRFVDVDEVMQSAKVFRDGLLRIKDYSAKKKKELETLSREIKKKRAMRQTLNPGTEEYEKVSVEIAFLEDKGKILQEMAKRWMDRENVKLQNYVYKLIRKAVDAYASANHLRAVLALKEFKPKGRRGKPPGLTLQDNVLRSVLWADPTLNVTSEIIKMVNQ